MEPRLSLITFGVPDVAAAREFYVTGLGWTPVFDVPGTVFFQVAPGVALSLFGADELVADIGVDLGRDAGKTMLDVELPADDEAAAGWPGDLDTSGSEATPAEPNPTIANVTLARNVGSEAEVLAVLDAAHVAGARILKPGQRAEWGGFHGYFADPAGIVWEVAHNPGLTVTDDGTVTLGPATPTG